jgi:hypothetical protein
MSLPVTSPVFFPAGAQEGKKKEGEDHIATSPATSSRHEITSAKV